MIVKSIPVLSLILIAFCGAPGSYADEKSTTAKSEIRIGVAVAVTGSAAPFGTAELNAATMALEEINGAGGIGGVPLKFVVEDTQSTNLHTVNAVTKLLTLDGLKIIIGPTWLDSFAGALPIAEKHGALLITPSAVQMVIKKNTSQYPLVFSTYFDQGEEIRFLLQRVKESGAKSIAIVFDQDPFYEVVHAQLREQATGLGLEVKQDISMQVGSSDFRSVLTKFKGARVDAVVFGFADEAAILAFLKQRVSMLSGVPLFGLHDLDGYVGQPQFKGMFPNTEYSGPAAPREFSARYRKRFGTDPVLTASNAYDAVLILVQAMRVGNFDPDAIALYFRTHDLQTETFGTTRFDALGGIASGKFEIRRAS